MNGADLWQSMRVAVEKILPAHCLACKQRCYKPEWLCHTCERAVEYNRCVCQQMRARGLFWGPCEVCGSNVVGETIQSLSVPLLNNGVGKALIQQWKFQSQPQLTSLLVGLAVREQHWYRPPAPMIVPMPMHWWKRYRRGYNQSELLAGALARHWQQRGYAVTTHPGVLKSRFRVRDQHTLGRKQRLIAPQYQFRVAADVGGQHLLLIDDVVTTGATLEAAAAALLAAGAATVSVWCLAKTP